MKRILLRSFRAGIALLAAFVMIAAVFDVPAKADEPGILTDAVWEYLFESEALTGGIVQSICTTDQYIITIENAGDDPTLSDVVTAYWRTDHDRNGNPVTKFSIANRVQCEQWEHGNGMCWNPSKNEIYVTLYTNTIEENRGCLYVMDPDTLLRKEIIKVSDEFNLLAIDYDRANDWYYVQTNTDGGYSILILDSNFNIAANLGPEPADPGYNFQDFCLAGDYLLQFPLTWDMGIGEYMMAYSVSLAGVTDLIQLFFDELPGEEYIEPESIAWLDNESFIVPVNTSAPDGSKRCLFYRASFPHLPASSPWPKEQAVEQQMQTMAEETPEESVTPTDAPANVNITKGNQELSRPEPVKQKKKFPVWIVILIIILLLLAAAGFAYVQYIRRERAKREARMRKKRRAMMARLQKEMEELDFNTDTDIDDE